MNSEALEGYPRRQAGVPAWLANVLPVTPPRHALRASDVYPLNGR